MSVAYADISRNRRLFQGEVSFFFVEHYQRRLWDVKVALVQVLSTIVKQRKKVLHLNFVQ